MIARALILLAALCLASGAGAAPPDAEPAFGPELQGFDYPFPVKTFDFDSQRQPLRMAYMDVAAAQPNGRVAVLLHGKNFCAATWEATIRAQRSRLPRDRAGSDWLLQIEQAGTIPVSVSSSSRGTPTRCWSRSASSSATIIGHSTGGMLAVRYALMYPREVERSRWSTRLASRTGRPRACPRSASINGMRAS